MPRLHVRRVCASALLALLCLVLPAAGKLLVPRDLTDVTVILAGGWELPGMTVRWSEADGGVWVVRADGARRLYRPAELSGLRDAGGRDVTREVLPAWALDKLAASPGTSFPGWQAPPLTRPEREVGYAEIGARQPERPRREDWRFLFGLEAGMDKSHDDDFGDRGAGLGFGLRTRIQLVGPIFLAGGFSWYELPGRQDVYVDPAPDYDFETIDSSGDVQIAGYWAGLSLLPPGETGDAARFYLEGGVGRYEVEGLVLRDPEEAYLGYSGGVGFLVPLGTGGALDLGVRGLHIVNLDTGRGDDRHTMLGFHLGVSLLAR
jgi:hypothetical protein